MHRVEQSLWQSRPWRTQLLFNPSPVRSLPIYRHELAVISESAPVTLGRQMFSNLQIPLAYLRGNLKIPGSLILQTVQYEGNVWAEEN